MNANRIQISEILENVKNNPEKYIKLSEEFFKSQSNKVLNFLMQNKAVKVILLAGPSGSGKTTTSNLLAETLMNNGFNSLSISLDNFFVERPQNPLWEDGTYNFETPDSIDWELFGKVINDLLEFKPTVLPVFNFYNGTKSFDSDPITLKKDAYIIIEGLHALNPVIEKYIDSSRCLKVCISVNTDIYDKDKKLVAHEGVRFYRRLIRDVFTRGLNVNELFQLRKNVNLGEQLYITPFIENAQIRIDSFHPYELCVYHNVYKKFEQFNNPVLDEQRKILSLFDEIDFEKVPKNSVLQEFLPKK